MNKIVDNILQKLQQNNLSALELKEIKQQIENHPDQFDELFANYQDDPILPSELLFAYYSVRYESDQAAQLSKLDKQKMLIGFKLKRFKRHFTLLPALSLASGMAIILLLIVTFPSKNDQETIRYKDSSPLNSLTLPHTLNLLSIDKNGLTQELVEKQAINTKDSIVFTLTSRSEGHLFLWVKNKSSAKMFFPEGNQGKFFTIEQNNQVIQSQQGIVSYLIEESDQPITFCSFLVENKLTTSTELEKLLQNRQDFTGDNCKTLLIRR